MPTDTLTTEDAVRLAGIIFGLAAEVRRLDGEFDDNFLLLVAGQPHSVLKVSRPEEQRAFLDLQAKVLGRLGRIPDTAAFQFPQLLPTRNATTLATVPDGCPGAGRFIRLLSYIPGCRHLAEVVPCPPPLLTSLGTLLATVDRALLGLDDPAAHRTRNGSGDDRFRWALADSLWVRDALTHVKDARRRALAGWVLDRVYTAMLAFAMRHRMAVSLIALAVVLSSIPLYRAVKQEFIPSNVDEAEFEVSVNAPEGTNLATMNETMQIASVAKTIER